MRWAEGCDASSRFRAWQEPTLPGVRSGRRVARPKPSNAHSTVYLLLCPEGKNPFARAEKALVSKLE
jgi:hypothetical protein